MNKIIVTVFENEEKAFKGLEALRELHFDGDISVHASAVISKDEDGKALVKEHKEDNFLGTSLATAIGAIVGFIGGPAGVALGSFTGFLGGMVYDLDKAGVDKKFVDQVKNAMDNNSAAIVADIEEGWVVPLNTRMEELGGEVFRKNRYEVEEDRMQRTAQEISAELIELHEEWQDAGSSARVSIQNQMDTSKRRRQKLMEDLNNKRQQLKKEWNAKVENLNKQIEDSKEQNKKKLENRRSGINADYERRKQKLDKTARELAGYVL